MRYDAEQLMGALVKLIDDENFADRSGTMEFGACLAMSGMMSSILEDFRCSEEIGPEVFINLETLEVTA